MITIYTDGSSKGNPGPGGFGAIIFGENDSSKGNVLSIMVKEIGGREEKTTNNRMEMMAAIKALKNTPKNSEIEIFSDSEYLINGITKWIINWQKNNWKTKNKKQVLNKDLWQELLAEVEKRNVEWEKVLGHSGHEFNERCDEIATSFADGIKVDLFEGSKRELHRFISLEINRIKYLF